MLSFKQWAELVSEGRAPLIEVEWFIDRELTEYAFDYEQFVELDMLAEEKVHTVRLEYGIQQGEFADYQVKATSHPEAIKKAIAKHRKSWPYHTAHRLQSNATVLDEALQDIPVKVINSPRPADGPFKGQNHRLAIQRAGREVPSKEASSGNHWQRVREGAKKYFTASKEEQGRMRDDAHKVLGHVSLLGDESSNPKLTKSGEKIPEYRTKGLTLAPSTRSGIDVCPAASKECKAACLGSAAGRGVMKPVQDARAKRTRKLFDHPHLFYAKLDHEIENAKQTAHKNGQKLAVRLNVASDVPHEHLAPHLFHKHGDVQFYDYTKVHGRTSNAKKPENLHLTISSTGLNHGESNWKHVRKHLDRGGVAAMAFDVSSRDKNAKLPSHVHDEETGKLYRVVDGDEHDHRHLDKKLHGIPDHEGVIAGLKFKGGKPNIARAGNFAVHAEGGVAVAKKGMN